MGGGAVLEKNIDYSPKCRWRSLTSCLGFQGALMAKIREFRLCLTRISLASRNKNYLKGGDLSDVNGAYRAEGPQRFGCLVCGFAKSFDFLGNTKPKTTINLNLFFSFASQLSSATLLIIVCFPFVSRVTRPPAYVCLPVVLSGQPLQVCALAD